MSYLAIDYGTKRIGISVSDPTNTIAVSYPTMNNDKKFLKELKKILDEKEIQKIIIGYPLKLDGKRSELCEEIDKLVEKINKIFKFEIIKRDERLSSKIAEAQIIESVTSRTKRRDKSLIDKFSASVILQEYLNYKKYENTKKL